MRLNLYYYAISDEICVKSSDPDNHGLFVGHDIDLDFFVDSITLKF